MEDGQRQKYDFGKKCVCVGRVSTSSQSQTAQIEDLKAYARSLGYTRIQPFFTTESGFLEYDDKIGWNLVTSFFETHPDYKVLICSEISRLSRRKSILDKIEEYLVEHKIQLYIKDIHFRLFDEFGEISPGNDLVFTLFASLASSEMRQKKERFRRALADYRRLGYSIGGKELFGYDRYYERKDGKDRSKYRINDDEAEQIRTIYRWYAFGIDGDLTKTSILDITKKCIEEGFSHYLHSKRNVNKCLKERAYLGQKETHNRVHNAEYWSYKNHDKPKYIEGKSFVCIYPAIFEGENVALFEKVQQRLIENNSKFNKYGVPVDKSRNHITILSKLIKCPSCGTYLHGEYRIRKFDKRRPNVGVRYYNTYRCCYTRGHVKKCDFNHLLSMPLMDSVVWAYCKEAVIHIINSETRKSTKEQIDEIDKKIANIDNRIKDFNIDARIKAEEAILRSKTAILKNPDAVQTAVTEFQQHVESIDKELTSYEKRKLELEQEREGVKNSASVIGSLAQQQNITSNKKQLYQYVHRLIDKIEIVFCNRLYTVLKVHLKSHFLSYRSDEYICLSKKTTQKITSLLIHPVDLELEKKVQNIIGRDEKDFWNLTRDNLPSNNSLIWDDDNEVFNLNEIPFSLEDLFLFHTNSLCLLPPEERVLHTDISILPLRVKEMNVERLNCYEEDERE